MAATLAGKRTVNSLPWPRTLSAVAVPPCSSTSRCTKHRPMPKPPCERSIDRSAWVNRSKMRGNSSGAMPMPLSLTRITTVSPSTSIFNPMRPPSSVYLAAFVSRLTNTCSRRAASACNQTDCGGIDMVSTCRCCANSCSVVSMARSTMPRMVTCSRRSWTLPVVMREISSRSPTRCCSCPTWRSMIFLACR